MRSLLAVFLTLACFSHPVYARSSFVSQDLPATVSVCFVPAQTCDAGIVAALNAAKTSIRVQAYGFTSAAILRALVEAKTRGVDVAVILDKSNNGKKYTGATFITNADIPTWIDLHPAIAHNKLLIIDSHLVIGGSYNYTRNAERNAENVIYMESAPLAAVFQQNWESRKAVSEVYTAASKAPTETVDE